MSEPVPYLGAYGIAKSYGPVRALRGVDVELYPGEVHALVGENGAGKSTLKKILGGEERSDRGEIRVNNVRIVLGSPADARRHGIAVVHQHFPMISTLSVAENMHLGEVPRRGGDRLPFIDRRRMVDNAIESLDQFGLSAVAQRTIRDLSVAERQVVAIATALRRRGQVLILDEPTSSLSASEVENLFRHVRRLRDEGRVVVFITHSMEEVLAVADRVTVFRDGQRIDTVLARDIDTSGLVRMIVGRDLAEGYPKATSEIGGTLLAVEDIVVRRGARWRLDLRRGETLGLPAHMGSGIGDLLDGLSGRARVNRGLLSLDGRNVTRGRERDRIRAGVCLVPGDASAEGLIPKLTIAENILLPNLARFSRWGIVRRSRAVACAEDLIRVLDIRPADPEALVENLSGGNRQKVVIAKWLAAGAKVLVMDDPTKGVDVGAKVEIYSVVGDLVRRGNAVLWASSDLDELMGLSDRIFVIREGRIVRELDRRAFDKTQILELLIGGLPSAEAAALNCPGQPELTEHPGARRDVQ